MNTGQDYAIGIVGGMGPEAGITLFNYILGHTAARTDQEHIPVVLMSFPGNFPDRTSFLEGRETVNPGYSIAEVIQKLEAAGAGIVGIACNTSHSVEILNVTINELRRSNSGVKLIHMPYEACMFLKDNFPRANRIGVMCTNGTYRSKLYEHLLKENGYEAVVPDTDFQNDVIHRIIYDRDFGIKANAGHITIVAEQLMNQAIEFFRKKKTDAIILGCTELPLVMKKIKCSDIHMIDSMEALALALIREFKLQSDVRKIKEYNTI